MKKLEMVSAKQDKYPIFYGIFGESIKKAVSKHNGSNHPLLEVVNKGKEALWEKELQKALNILGLSSSKEFNEVYKLHPNNIASSGVSFLAFMAEIYVLFSLHSFGFKNIKKIKEQDNMVNPDYTAELRGQKFVIEVWKREQGENAEEFAIIDVQGKGKGPYSVTEIEKCFERIVELKLPKFERQMKGCENFKKIAAIYYPGRMLGLLADKRSLNSVGKRLLQKTKGKVDYFLFRFKYKSLKYSTKTFIVPKPLKGKKSN